MHIFRTKICVLKKIYFLTGWLFFTTYAGAFTDQRSADSDRLLFRHLSTAEGLSNDDIYCLLADRKGFLWFGTSDGLNRYDGYQIEIFLHHAQDPHSLSESVITSLCEDRQGLLWIGTKTGGLNCYSPDSGVFTRFREQTGPLSHIQFNIVSMIESGDGSLWIATLGDGLFRRDPSGAVRQYRSDTSDPHALLHDQVWTVFEDRKARIWAGTANGLCLLEDEDKARFRHYRKEDGLPENRITTLFQDRTGYLWVGTWRGGLSRLNLESQEFTNFANDPADPRSLSPKEVRGIFEDSRGNLWIGTRSGLNRFDHESGQFSHYRKDPDDPRSLGHDRVRAIYEDQRGVLWLATSEGVNYLPAAALVFDSWRHIPGKTASLASNRVSAVMADRVGNLWIGTDAGLNRISTSGDYTLMTDHAQAGKSLSANRISALLEDDEGFIWVGTEESGLNRLDPTSGEIRSIRSKENLSYLNNERITTLMEASDGRLWVGTNGAGLNRSKENRFRPYDSFEPVTGDGHSLSYPVVTCMLEDREKSIWVGTAEGGLNRYNPRAGHFDRFGPDQGLNDPRVLSLTQTRDALWIGTQEGLSRFDFGGHGFSTWSEEDGLPNKYIHGLLSDDRGFLWLSTNRGLVRFDPKNASFLRYESEDGLPGNAFLTGAVFQRENGRLFFGGTRGLIGFRPENLPNFPPPPVVLTDLRIANNSVRPGVEGSPLKRRINQTEKLALPYGDMITLGFAAIDQANTAKIRYRYRMENLHEDWIETSGGNRGASFSRLWEGTYQFHAQALGAAGVWEEPGVTLELKITPPVWRSIWAYFFYTLTVLAMLVGYTARQQRKLEKERAVVAGLRQLDQLKDDFLANTSHELRTPLNGIIGLSESLTDGIAGELPEKARQNLAMITSSGNRLYRLVNDILDFSAVKNGRLVLDRKPVDLRAMTDVVFTLCDPGAAQKELVCINQVPADLPAIPADEDRLQQILVNLVDNAVKFTERGTIVVSAHLDEGDLVVVKVKDTGIGVPEHKLSRIFESFEQAETSTSRRYGGSGLGLAITKQMVALHGGTILVNSKEGEGSEFRFTLPLRKGVAPIKPSVARFPIDPSRTMVLMNPVPILAVAPLEGSFRILIVEDEAINRQVLSDHLTRDAYELVLAENGPRALEILAEQEDFDIVLLDVMMPLMSGYQVCHRIRERYPAHRLPVIFLSAKTRVTDRLLGFSSGANDYLSKPVSKRELLARVELHLRLLVANRNLADQAQKLESQRDQLVAIQKQMILKEKLASVGFLISGITHEINNPTQYAHGSAYNLLEELEDFKKFLFQLAGEEAEPEILEALEERLEPLFEYTETVKEATHRIQTIVRGLHSFVRSESGEKRPASISELLETTLGLAQARYKDSIDFVQDYQQNLQLICRPDELNQVFMNLIINACQAILKKQEKEQVRGKLYVTTRTEGKEGLIDFRDTGSGMSAEVLSQVFEPFFTTKAEGQGTGMGLPLSQDIVAKHDGRIEVTSIEGEGTTFSVYLPLDGSFL